MTATPTSTTAPPLASLIVTLEATVVTHHTFDLVKELNSLTDGERAEYWALDGHEFEDAGCEHEWERPLVWLRGRDALLQLLSVDVNDVDEQNLVVEPGHVCAPFGNWSAAAYDVLCAAVPWLTPREDITDADLARLPSPLDVPINLGPRGGPR